MIITRVEYRCDYCGPDRPAFVGLHDGEKETHACRSCADKQLTANDSLREFWGLNGHVFEWRPDNTPDSFSKWWRGKLRGAIAVIRY